VSFLVISLIAGLLSSGDLTAGSLDFLLERPWTTLGQRPKQNASSEPSSGESSSVEESAEGEAMEPGDLESLLRSEPELRVQAHEPHRPPTGGVSFSDYSNDERVAPNRLAGGRSEQLRKWSIKFREFRKERRRFGRGRGRGKIVALAKTDDALDSELLPECRGGGTAGRVARLAENPFCALAVRLPSAGDGSGGKTIKRGKVSKATARRVERLLVAAKIRELGSYSEKEVSSGLNLIRDPELLFPVFHAALEAKVCPSPKILTQLGLRAESGFPSTQFQELAVRLYERSIGCGGDDAGIRAGYRLGLIRIWQKKWKEADRVLAKVGDFSEGADYRTRVLYWRAVAASEEKNQKLASTLRTQLIRDYPLSVHATLASFLQGPADIGMPQIQAKQPMILFRSYHRPDLNPALESLDGLAQIRATDLVAELAESLLQKPDTLEPEVRLFLIHEMRKAGNLSLNFKYLAELFRDFPEMIASSTLSLMYPLHRFDLIRQHEKIVDPYLVVSLIRQESAFNDQARSIAGARGLMQLMPATARRMERVSVYSLFQPKTNIRLGVKFFGKLLERFSGQAEDALAGYNAGPLRVDEWRRRYPVEDPLLFVDLMPFKETREYVASIARNYYWYLRLYQPETFEQTLKKNARSPASIKSGFRIFEVAFQKKLDQTITHK
jgi:soluble lytic murein transglycosylase